MVASAVLRRQGARSSRRWVRRVRGRNLRHDEERDGREVVASLLKLELWKRGRGGGGHHEFTLNNKQGEARVCAFFFFFKIYSNHAAVCEVGSCSSCPRFTPRRGSWLWLTSDCGVEADEATGSQLCHLLDSTRVLQFFPRSYVARPLCEAASVFGVCDT